ncbi:MAG: glycosyltransferase [Candidatus Brennerbacteria bacterium]|nr:glycosyltransferase [Candidatus Brennerbacteria bacterium]
MKVLLGGFPGSGTSEHFARRAFENLGVELEFFDFSSYHTSPFNKAVNRFREVPLYFGTQKLNAELIEAARKFKPDFILLFKPILINPRVVLALKETPCKVFSWYPDYVSFPKTASVLFYASISAYDCHFSFNYANAEELKNMGAVRSLFIPCGADSECHKPTLVPEKERTQWAADIAFVGTYAPEKRVEFLEKLCGEGYHIKIWGNAWEGLPKDSCLAKRGCVQYRAVNCEEMGKVVAASKIILAFVRGHNKETLACRTFEIPAYGGFMLHERTAKTGEFLKEGEEAEFFADYHELKRKIDFYLSHGEARKIIAERGRRRVVEGGNLMVDRVRAIIEVFKTL